MLGLAWFSWLWLAGLLLLVGCEMVHLFGSLESALKVQPLLLPLAVTLVITPVLWYFLSRRRPAPPPPPPAKAPAQPQEVLRQVGSYALLAELGQGAFGKVYKAVNQQRPDQFWALKHMQIGLTAQSMEVMRENFDREQKVLSWLNHPGIVARKEFFTQGDSFYLVMEYVEGCTLRQLLNANGPLTYHCVIPLVVQTCQALAYLHSQKPRPIIFRDLKPGNLMVSADGTVKLIDFGICRFDSAAQIEQPPLQQNDEVTEVLGRCQDTICLGTPGYAAPEQYPQSAGGSDHRCDIYALGVLMWELLGGARPPRQPQVLPPLDVPEALQAIVDRATALEPEQRYSSARLMASALTAFAAAHPPDNALQRQAFTHAYASCRKVDGSL